MRFKFEEHIIWQKSMEFGESLSQLSHKFPEGEMYNLSSRIRKAGDSIALYISEGAIGQSDPEFKKFIGYAIRSLAEVVTCLHKAYKRNYVSQETFKEHYAYAFNLMNMMITFRKNIK